MVLACLKGLEYALFVGRAKVALATVVETSSCTDLDDAAKAALLDQQEALKFFRNLQKSTLAYYYLPAIILKSNKIYVDYN
jgi:hypothetical protein